MYSPEVREKIRISVVLLVCVSALTGSVFSQSVVDKTNPYVHVEKNGVISMEMEHAAIVNKWIVSSGNSGEALTCPVNGGHTFSGLNHTFARFNIRVAKTGKYTIWTLAKAGKAGVDYITNEFNMRLDPNITITDPITRLDEGQPNIEFKLTKDPAYVISPTILNAPSTILWLSRMPQDRNGDRFSKMRVSEADQAGLSFGWRSLAKSKRPYQRGEPVGTMYLEIKTPGEHILEVYGNGETGWTIDKIVLHLDGSVRPAGTGPGETLAATYLSDVGRPAMRVQPKAAGESSLYSIAGRSTAGARMPGILLDKTSSRLIWFAAEWAR